MKENKITIELTQEESIYLTEILRESAESYKFKAALSGMIADEIAEKMNFEG